jgi:hypothetical protein
VRVRVRNVGSRPGSRGCPFFRTDKILRAAKLTQLDVSGPCEFADKGILLGIEGELGNRARHDTANAMRLILPNGDPDILHDHLFIVGELTRLIIRFHIGNLRVPGATLNACLRRHANSGKMGCTSMSDHKKFFSMPYAVIGGKIAYWTMI